MPRTPPGPGRPFGSGRRRGPDVGETQPGRAGFGNRLRRLREERELTGKELARQLGWAASKVSRLEHGKQTATAQDVRALMAVLDVADRVRDDLIGDLRSMRVDYATWKRQLRGGFAGRQRVARLLDSGAATVLDLQTAVVPGLLQTADYARALFRGLAEVYGPRDVEAAVHERIRRQGVLTRPDRDLRFLVTESALRSRVGSVAVHRAQLDRLLVVAGFESVRIAVLPWTAELPTSPDHNFVVFDDRLVLVETINAELAVRDEDDVALYRRLFDLFWDAAEEGDGAAALIARVAGELP